MPERPSRPVWRTPLVLVLCALLLPVLLMASTVAMIGVPSYVEARPEEGTLVTTITNLGVLAWLVSVVGATSAMSLRWTPWIAWTAGLVNAVLLGLDPLLLFAATGVVVATRSTVWAWRATAVAGLVAGWVVLRNALRSRTWQWLFDVTAPQHPAVVRTVDVVLTLGSFALCVGAGWMWRTRAERRAAEVRAERAEDDAADLSVRVGAVEERERLAREIHDALAHRLSLVSLHASALQEAVESDDPAVSEAAKVIRDNAHRSLEDLRELIDALRHPRATATSEPEPAPLPVTGMADVAEVIDSTMAAGIDVNAFVALDDPGSASDVLNHAVFRIVQECLTNVVKHAPGTRAGLDLRASPGRGVHIQVRNPMPAATTQVPGAGLGLVGIRERVAMLGGSMSAGVAEDGWFEVRVRLPWTERMPGASAASAAGSLPR